VRRVPNLRQYWTRSRRAACAGFVEAQRHSSALASAIFHDCDLLPPPGLLRWYTTPPQRGQVVHLAGAGSWGKYVMPGYDFLGGVTAFHPADFEACNGYPNDYWGWGMEDDQLHLRARASGALSRGVLRRATAPRARAASRAAA